MEVYSFLHIPVDTIVFEEAKNWVPGMDVQPPPDELNWSQCKPDQYCNYQEQLRDAIHWKVKGLAPWTGMRSRG